MSKSGHLKWCVVVVALLVLYVYQRQNKLADSVPPLGKTVSLPGSSPGLQDDAYTGLSTKNSDKFEPEIEPAMHPPERDDSRNSAAESEVRMPFCDRDEQSFDELELDDSGTELPEQMDHVAQLPAAAESADTQPAPDQYLQPQRLWQGPATLPDGAQTRIVQHIEYGKALARRNAFYGAQEEFENALKLIAAALDLQTNSQDYSAGLQQASLALTEAAEFYQAQGEPSVQSGVKEIAQRHRSKILSPDQASSLNLVQAMQAYFDFAQRQLVQSGGSTVVAGEALYCLGKLFVLRGRTIVDGGPLDAARSIVYYQAALESDPRHYKSANELGVMMAKSGRFEYAKRLLLQSLRVHQIAQTWENLAHVHQQLGELELAQAAMFEYQQMLNDSPSSNRIKWVSPQQFVAQSPEPAELRTAQLEPGDHPSNDSSRTSGSTKAIFKRLF